MTTRDRRVIPATCQVHGGGVGFTNLVVSRRPTGEIVFDPHVDGSCVLGLDRVSADMLQEALGEWLTTPTAASEAT